MAGAIKNLMVRAGADFSPLIAQTKKASTSIKGMENSVKLSSNVMSQSIAGLFTAMGTAAAIIFAAKAVTQFAGSCITAASDLVEVQNVVDVTFGNMASKVNDFASSATQSFGLSELQAKKYAGAMGAIVKSSGVAKSKVDDMAISLTEVGADLASFYNISQDEAMEKVESGITGVIRPLKSLGISLTVANLEAYAMSQGITKSWQSMTEAEKVMIRYKYIMQVTADSQGDFARTSGTWANQVRLLSANFNQLKANIGSVLMQAVLPLLQGLNTLLSAAVAASSKLAALFGYKQKSTKGVAKADNDATDTSETAAGGGGGGNNNNLASFDKLNVLASSSGGGGTAAEAADEAEKAKSITAQAIEAIQQKLESLKTKFGPLLNAWEQFKGALKGVGQAFTDLWNSKGFVLLRQWMEKRGIEIINQYVGGALLIVTGDLQILSGVIETLSGLLNGNFSQAWQGVTGILQGANTLAKALFTITLGPEAANAIDKIGQKIISGFGATLKWLGQGFRDIGGEFKALWTTAKQQSSDGWESLKKWWTSSVTPAWNTKIAPLFTSKYWANKWDGMKDSIKAAVKNGINGAIELFNRFIGWLNSKMKFSWPALTIAGKKIFDAGEVQLFTVQPIAPLATGGIVNGPTRALIGEAGREAVLPLENNTGWMDELAKKIGSRPVNVIASGSMAKFIRLLNFEIDSENTRKGTNLVKGGATG